MSASSGRNILVVDDETLITMLLEDMLDGLGHRVVGPANRLGEAIELARTASIDCAILDLRLDGEFSWAVAEALQARNIPFAFASGDDAGRSGSRFEAAPVLQKPFNLADLSRMIDALVAPTKV
jgi:CheY-like chemotaxis protein